MKRVSIKVLSIMIFMLTIVFVNNIDVFASENGTSGNYSDVATCGASGNCFGGAVGFRITIVNKNGNRCAYTSSGLECDDTKLKKIASKYKSKSVDYWFARNTLASINLASCKAYNEKRTKKEFLSLKDKNKGIVKCSSNGVYKSINYIDEDLGFPSANSYEYTAAWVSSPGIDDSRTPVNINLIIDYFTCATAENPTSLQNFNGTAKLKCKSRNGKTIKKNKNILKNIFNNSFIVKPNIDSLILSDAYIQFEQLLQIQNWGGIGSGYNFYFTGTVTEASYLYRTHNYNGKTSGYYRWCTVRNDKDGKGGMYFFDGNKATSNADIYSPKKVLNHNGCASFMITGGYWTGWYGTTSDGIGMKPNGSTNNLFDKLTANYYSNNYKKYDSLKIFLQKDTANVFAYWGKNITDGGCESVAPNINGKTFAQYYTNLSKDKRLSTAEKEQITWMKDAAYYGFKNVSELKKWAKNSCAKPSCEESYALHKKNKISGFNDKIPTLASSAEKKKLTEKDGRWNYKVKSIISAFSLGTSNANICKVSTCEEILNNLSLKNKYNTLDSTKKSYIEMIDTHKELFGGYNYKYLNKTILNEMKIVIPACEGKLPDCSNVDNITSCTSPFDIKVGKDASSDSSYRANCILGGFLYNKGSNYYSSLNNTYTGFLEDSKQYKVYCSEKIDIDMPQINSGYLKAGRVFQWGKDIDQNTNTGLDSDKKTFATMTVTHQCYKGYATPNGKNVAFTVKEINKFKNSNSHKSNTSIAFSYTDPLKKFPSLNNISYDRIFESKNTSTSSNMIQMKYVYNFVYGKSLTWYSHKGTEEKDLIDKNKYNTLSNQRKNEYLFIGYGAPTSYNTPDGTYKEIVKASIKNIGETGKYDHLYTGDTLEYKCDFKVHNEIIGNECCNPSTGKPYPGAPAYCTCDGGEEPKGLDVVFRTIKLVDKNTPNSNVTSELSRAFPGRTGAGRNLTGNIGKNWQTLINSDTKTVLNILRDDIYSSTPQYTIILDAGKISDIRTSNKKLRDMKIDPYTYRGSNKLDTGYTCYKYGEYGYCASYFVGKMIDGRCGKERHNNTNKVKVPCE